MQNNIQRQDAEQLLRSFLPILDYFEQNKINYCVIGGIAVLIHCYVRNSADYRQTKDLDFIVPNDYQNSNATEDYLNAFSKNSSQKEQLKLIILGDNESSNFADPYENISIEGAVKKLDGFQTPNVDICRSINEVDATTIKKERIEILGRKIWVATIKQLIKMKKDVITIYGSDPTNSSRFHDFIDLKILENLLENN